MILVSVIEDFVFSDWGSFPKCSRLYPLSPWYFQQVCIFLNFHSFWKLFKCWTAKTVFELPLSSLQQLSSHVGQTNLSLCRQTIIRQTDYYMSTDRQLYVRQTDRQNIICQQTDRPLHVYKLYSLVCCNDPNISFRGFLPSNAWYWWAEMGAQVTFRKFAS